MMLAFILLYIEKVIVKSIIIEIGITPEPKTVVEVIAKVHEIAKDHVALRVLALALTLILRLSLLLL